MDKGLLLYLLSVKAFFHRLRFDLARELVVALSSAVLIGLFFYIFNDFLNNKVQALSATMARGLAGWFAGAILAVIALIVGRTLRRVATDEASFAATAARLGESPSPIRLLSALQTLTIIAVWFGLAWWIIARYFVAWSVGTIALAQALALALVALMRFLPSQPDVSRDRVKRPLLPEDARSVSRLGAVYRWRMGQLAVRGRLTRLCLAAALVFAALTGLVGLWSGPFFAAILASLVTGLFAAASLAFQASEDLTYAWAERSMGLSHEDVMRAYYMIGLTLAAASGLAAFGLYCLGAGGPAPEGWAATAKLFALGGLAPAVMPMLLFQIDPKRPAIPITTSVLVCLFLGTAIFAHWLSIVLCPLLKYYADGAQAGRFYRA